MSRLSTEEFAKVWGTLKSLQTKQLVAIDNLIHAELDIRHALVELKASQGAKQQ